MAEIALRPFQQRTVDALRAQVERGVRRAIVVGPTGCGKAVTMTYIAYSAAVNYGLRVLILVHRLELVDQTRKQTLKWGPARIGVMRADDDRTDAGATIQIATSQTLARRKLPAADIVLSDEAHHDASDGRKAILQAYPDAIILGWSASPIRLDNKPLRDLYDVIEVSATYSELIEDEFIVAPIVYAPPVRVDLDEVHTRAGDYVLEELEIAMDRPQVTGNIVEEWKRRAEGRHTVVFACTIKHSKSIVDRFVQAGIRAEHLDGDTPEDVRRACLKRLDDGLTQVVSQCNVLTEGWDQPSVKCLILARPTKSLSLFMQMSGRALRPWHPDGLASNESIVPIILDHANNVEEHGMPHEDRIWSLEGHPRKANYDKKYRTCPGCYAYVLKNPCELCGHLAETKPREVKEVGGTLVQKEVVDERRSHFLAQMNKARLFGYKPGFAAAKFKEKYGAWPPWSWSTEAKMAYSKDEGWQAREQKRSRERTFWQGRQEGGIEVDIPDEEIPF